MASQTSTEGRRHILIVDDEDGIRALLETRLLKMGFRVSVAGNALHAVQKVKGSGIPIDLIICDLKMPKMNGIEFFESVKQMAEISQPQFIMMTGNAERNLIMQAIKSGIKEFYLKPFKQKDLVDKVNELLKIAPVEVKTAA